MKTLKPITALLFVVMLSIKAYGQGSLTPVSSFGSNPGNLNMYYYVPSGITQASSLVLALHGCSQTASLYAVQSGWNKLADRHKFIVVYPEQITANNSSKCFNWFDATDQSKNQGEALSIKQMVDYMKLNYVIDTTKIFVTGLSAGAGMTTVMLAAYPEVFNKGAIMAGLPYKASSSSITASTAMGGYVIKTPAQWSALVKNENPGYIGPFPQVAIFHGTLDLTVNINNATELIKQWTDLNNADQTADATNTSFQGNTAVEQTIYNDNLNNPVVYYYKITGMGHGISLDTGSCPRQGGSTATYAIEKNFHSTYWAADFFGIISNPYSISGAIQVIQNASNVTYSVVNTIGSTYTWTVPTGATIVSGQGSNSIVINFGLSGGFISIQETTSAGCKNDIASLYVTVQFNVTVSQTSPILCNGSSTATLSATATGGTGSYTYNWSPSGGTAAIASGLGAGVYSVTITDAASVVVTSSSFTVNEPSVIAVSQTITICAGETFTVGQHTYNTSNTYLDTLTASNACDSLLTTYLTVYPLTTVSLNLAGNDTVCSNDAAFVLSGGNPISGAYGGQGISAGSFDPALANSGWNVVTYTVADGNSCAYSAKDSLFIKTCFITGLSDFDILKNISIYPNPASDAVCIAVNKMISFELNLYNSIGTLILVKRFNANVANIDIHSLPEGIYLLIVKIGQGLVSHRIIKQ